MGSRPSDADQLRRPSMSSLPEEHKTPDSADASLHRPQADLSMPALQPISVKRVPSAGLNRPVPPQWLLFNDFSVTPAAPSEVTQLYGVQKVPCLLYYTQVQSVFASFIPSCLLPLT